MEEVKRVEEREIEPETEQMGPTVQTERGGEDTVGRTAQGDGEKKTEKGPNQRGRCLLYFAHGEHHQTHTIYSTDECKIYAHIIPQFATKTMLMSSHGWFLMEDLKTGELTLVNPVSMEVIGIPSPSPLPQPAPFPEFPWEGSSCNNFLQYGMTTAPTEKDCILFSTTAMPYMNFYVFQEKRWFQRRYMKKTQERPLVVVCNGDIYVMRSPRSSVKLVFDNYKLTIQDINLGRPEDLFPRINEFLIESSGELFFVKSVPVIWSKLIRGFIVYKMNFTETKWVPARTIHHRAFCLNYASKGMSLSCNAHDAGLQQDCIYYISQDHLYQYNLLDRSNMLLISFKNLQQPISLPCWVLPSPQSKNLSTNKSDFEKNLETNENFQRRNGIMTNSDVLLDDQKFCIENGLASILLSRHCTRKPAAMENSSQEKEPWSKLIPELVPEILRSLSYIDSRCLIHAIPRWLPAIRASDTWQLDSPCLLSFSNDYKTCKLFDPLRNMCHVIDSSIVHNDANILYSKYGWLLLFASEPSAKEGTLIFFYNPLTKSRIFLPPLTCQRSYDFLFLFPPTSSNCVVVAYEVSIWYREIIICRKGYQNWIVQFSGQFPYEEINFAQYTTPVFLNDKLYWSGVDGRIRLFDLATGLWEVHGFTLEMPHDRHYLVESEGNIFWVRGTLNGDSICLYKLNLSSYLWDKTHSSGGCCLFLSQRVSISVSASDFKDNEEKLYFPMLQNRDMVYYSCKTHKVHPSKNFEGVKELLLDSCWIEPHWAQPTAKELQWSM